MSQLAIKNISTERLWLRDLYAYLDPGETKFVERTPTEMGDMRGLQDYIDRNLVEVTIVLPPGEIKSELVAVWPLGLNWRPDVPTLIALNALPVAKNRLADLRIVTGTLIPYVWDGVAWLPFVNFIGPPAAHATTHKTGGIDVLAIQATATGVTVNSATATNNALVQTGWYALNTIEADGVSQGILAQSAASSVPTAQPGVPRTMRVVFPAGWTGGTVTINGIGRGGAVISEVFTKPGGGGTVAGVKPFFLLTNFVNSSVVGPGFNVTVELDFAFGVPNENVVAFLKVSVDGANDSFSIADVANGTFDPVSAHHGNHGVDVWYTYSTTALQAAHTHTVTDPTHAHNVV
jgi:hypothetical protein